MSNASKKECSSRFAYGTAESLVDNKWSTAENWVGDLSPQLDDNLVFPASASQLTNVNDFDAGSRFRSITISGSGYDLQGTNSVTLLEGVVANNTTGANTIEFGILLGANQSFVSGCAGTTLILNGTINTGDTAGANLNLYFDGHGTTTVNGVITGQGIVNKIGDGTLVLTGNNDYVGYTFVRGGIVELQSNNALGSTNGFTYAISGSQVRINGNGLNIPEVLMVNSYGNWSSVGSTTPGPAGTTQAGDDVFDKQGGGLLNRGGSNEWSGQVLLGGAGAMQSIGVDSGSTLKISSQILAQKEASGGGLYKLGGGMLEMSGSAANQIIGDVWVLDGTLKLNKTAGLAVGGNVYVGNLYSTGSSATATLEIANSNQQQSVTNYTNWVLNNLYVYHSGRLLLDQNVTQTVPYLQLYYGSTVSADVYLSTGSNLVLAGNVTSLAYNQQPSSGTSPAAKIEGPGTLDLGKLFSGSATNNYLFRRFNVGETLLQGAAVDLDISANITNAGALNDSTVGFYKDGAGVLRLSGNNEFGTGGTMIAQGIVELASDTAFGSASSPVDLRSAFLRAADGPRVINNRTYVEIGDLILLGTLPITFNGEMTLAGNSGDNNRSIVIIDPAMTATINGRISDDVLPLGNAVQNGWASVTFAKKGRGQLVLTNEISISGSLLVDANGGTLTLAGDARVQNTRTIDVRQGGTLLVDNTTGTQSQYEIEDSTHFGRFNNVADLMLRGGEFTYKGRAGVANSEIIGSTYLVDPYNSWIESVLGGAGGTNKLILGTVRRDVNTSARFIGTNGDLDTSTNQIIFTDPPGQYMAAFNWINTTLVNGILPYSRVGGSGDLLDVATIASVPEGVAIVALPADRYVTISTPGDITSLITPTSNVKLTAAGDYYVDTAFINSLTMADGVRLHGSSATTNLTIQAGNLALGDSADLNVPFINLGNPNTPLNIPGNLNSLVSVRGDKTATISGAIIGGTGTIMKVGLGRLILSGNNEFTGNFYVQEGMVRAQNNSAFGAPSGGVTVLYEAALEFAQTPDGQNLWIAPEAITVYGLGFNDMDGVVEPDEDRGVLRNISGDNAWTGNISQGATYYDCYAYFNSNNTVLGAGAVVYGVESGSLALKGALLNNVEQIKIGPGTLEFNGTQLNNSNQATRVKEGTLVLNKPNGLGPYQGTPLFIGDDDPTTAPAVVRLMGDEQIWDSSPVRVMSDGTLDLNGHTETINNLEMVNSATGGAQVTIGDGGNLIFWGGDATYIVNVMNLGNGGSTGARIDGGTLSLAWPHTTAINRNLLVADSLAEEDLTITSTIQDNSGIGFMSVNKYGYGSLELGGSTSNTFGGQFRVYEGRLDLNKTPGKNAVGGPLYIGDQYLQGGGEYADVVRWKQDEQLPDFFAQVSVLSSVMDLNGHSETLGVAPLQTGIQIWCGSQVNVTGGVLTVNGNVVFSTGVFIDKSAIIGGELRMGSGVGEVAHYFDITNTNAFPFELEISSNITGAASAPLIKINEGGLLLTGNNTYHGDTLLLTNYTFSALGVGSDHAFGDGVLALAQGSLATDGAPRTVTNRISVDSNLYFGTSASVVSRPGDSYGGGGGWWDLTLAGPVTLTGTRTMIASYPVAVNITGDIGELYGQQGMNKAGPGWFNLSGTDWQSGTINVNTGGGSLILKNGGHIENAAAINVYDGASLILDDTGTQSTDKIDDRIPISLFGGTLMFGNNRQAPTSETLGIVTIGAGISPGTIRSAAGPNSAAVITLEKLVPRGHLLLHGVRRRRHAPGQRAEPDQGQHG